jgi:outer membrane protein TolC
MLLSFALAASAQEAPKSYAMSLKEAIDHALQHNYKVINSGRDIQAAEQKKWETTATGLPQISASINYTNNFDLQKSLVPAEFFGGNPGDFIAVAFGTRHAVNAGGTLSQLIFDGSYIVALQAAKTYLQYYNNLKQKTDVDVREGVINAYGNVLLAEESIAILEKNRTTLGKTLGDTRETYENGLVEEENVEQLQITLNTVLSNLNNAQRLKDIAYNMLKLQLGIDIADTLTLTDRLDQLTQANLDLALTGSEFNIENNIDYKIGKNFVEQRRLELMREKSRALPTLSANLNAGYLGFGNEFEFFEREQQWLKFSNLNVNLNIPIFSSFARRSRTQQAKIAFEQAKTQLTETEQMITLQYQEAKSQYEFSIEEYQNWKQNLALAERIEHKQNIKFTEGLSTSFDFADAQRQLYSAQQSYLQSMIDVINRRATLEKIINNPQ